MIFSSLSSHFSPQKERNLEIEEEKFLLPPTPIFPPKQERGTKRRRKETKRRGKEEKKKGFSFFSPSPIPKRKEKEKEGNDLFFSLQNERKMEKEREEIRAGKVMEKKKTLSTKMVNKV